MAVAIQNRWVIDSRVRKLQEVEKKIHRGGAKR